ncbi:MAG TPA: hypothetical protein VGG29_10585 [Caulobacteraceae bacterium]|jgi:hypothetical protein
MTAPYAQLEGWTPIAFAGGPEPTLEWADLRGRRFDDGFFRWTVEAWRRRGPARTVRTGLGALAALDGAPSLDPALIIAHSARCGSTLLARSLGAIEGTVAVCEPELLWYVAADSLNGAGGAPAHETLRRVVRALGRVRFGDERRLVLKLSSPMTPFLPLFRRAFPAAPVIWLQRRPAEIVASELRAPMPWMVKTAAGEPAVLQRLILHALTVTFLAASQHVDDETLVIDYADLPAAAASLAAPRMGVTPSPDDLVRMRTLCGLDAKSGRPFERRVSPPLPQDTAAIVAASLDPLYAALDRRRAAQAAA